MSSPAPPTKAGRRAPPALRVQSIGSPAQADLRALAALLLRLDSRPPLTLVTPKAP